MPPQLRSSRAMPSSPVDDVANTAHHGGTMAIASSSSSTSYHRHGRTTATGGGGGRPNSPTTLSPSRSHEDVANLTSSQSLRSALHPTSSITSPSKTHAKYQGGMVMGVAGGGGGGMGTMMQQKRRGTTAFGLAHSFGRRMSRNFKSCLIASFSFAIIASTMFARGQKTRRVDDRRAAEDVVANGAASRRNDNVRGGRGEGRIDMANRRDGVVRDATTTGGRGNGLGWRRNDDAAPSSPSRTAPFSASPSSSSSKKLFGKLRNLRYDVDGGGGGRRHPRVVDAASMHGSVTSRRDVGGGSLSNVYAAVDEDVADLDGVVVVVDAGGGETRDDAHDDGDGTECVPMANWQTTSYPNCNTVHEIDMVRSSGMGSYAFPHPHHRPEDVDRRSISSHPPALHEHLTDLQSRYPTKRKRNAKSNAMGLMKEESIEFLGQGWFRSAWEMYVEEIPDYDADEEEWGFEESVVLKTLRIERDFLPEYYELHRRDALAMERLTFSPYVLDIYGYCGQSAINELANFGIEGMSSLEKVARSFRGMDGIEPVSKIKLQLASMLAAGVSHVHGIDQPDFPIPVEVDDDDSDDGSDSRRYDDHRRERTALLRDIADGRVKVASNATLVHYDLNPRNIAVVKRGKPKLNDFNVAELMTWDARNNRTCGFSGRFREPWWRAPEEMHFHMPNHTDPAPLTEKIDIYSLGNILMEILTTHSPWGLMQKGEAEEETRPKVARGELPEWPDDFNQTKLITDPALKAIHSAMMKCLRFNPEDRPTAGEVAAELFEAIDNLPEGFGDKDKWRREREIEDGRIEERKKLDENEEVVGEGYVDRKKWKRSTEMRDNTDDEQTGATRSASRRRDMRQREEPAR